MAQLMRPISTVTSSGGNFTGPSVHGSLDGTAPDTGDYWNGTDASTDSYEVLLTDLSGSTPGTGTCTVSIYQAQSDTNVAPSTGGSAPTYDLEVYQGATQIASRLGITPTEGTFTLDSNLTFAASSITDWSDVRVRFTSNGTGGSPGGRRGAATSYVDISTPDASADVNVTTTTEPLTITEGAADITVDVNVSGTTEPLTLTEGTATISVQSDVDVVTTTEPLTITEGTASVSYDVEVTGTTEPLTITEGTASVSYDVNVTGTTEPLTITEGVATIGQVSDVDVQTTTEPLTLTEGTASVSYDVNVGGVVEPLTITEGTSQVTLDVNVSGTTEALTITEGTASILYGTNVITTTEPLTIAEGVAEISLDVEVTASAEPLTITEGTATIGAGDPFTGTTIDGQPSLVVGPGTKETLVFANKRYFTVGVLNA